MKPTADDKNNEYLHCEALNVLIKQMNILDANLQKAYTLVLRQCTELLQSKLKQHPNWSTLQVDQDILALLKVIKGITYKLED
jgi:hypothetical protein